MQEQKVLEPWEQGEGIADDGNGTDLHFPF